MENDINCRHSPCAASFAFRCESARLRKDPRRASQESRLVARPRVVTESRRLARLRGTPDSRLVMNIWCSTEVAFNPSQHVSAVSGESESAWLSLLVEPGSCEVGGWFGPNGPLVSDGGISQCLLGSSTTTGHEGEHQFDSSHHVRAELLHNMVSVSPSVACFEARCRLDIARRCLHFLYHILQLLSVCV